MLINKNKNKKIITFNPLARLIALNGRSTRKTRKIFTTDIAPELEIIEKL